jgi:hypothetical protein
MQSFGRYRPASISWRPFLCAVYYVCDLHNIFEDPVNYYEGKRWQGKFTGPFHAARPALVWKRFQRSGAVVDCLGNALRGSRILLPDVFDDSEKVFSGGR